jgi:hypothetical protein
MPATTKRLCPDCREWFTPGPHNAHHQHYCWKPACRRASHRASSARWRLQNPDYFRGEENCLRVRTWRADHPGYWRRQRRSRRGHAAAMASALQDLASAEPTADEAVAPSISGRITAPEHPLPSLECPAPATSAAALQDLAFTQHVALTALVRHLRGEPLQDFIGRQLERVYQCGTQRWGVPGARAPP